METDNDLLNSSANIRRKHEKRLKMHKKPHKVSNHLKIIKKNYSNYWSEATLLLMVVISLFTASKSTEVLKSCWKTSSYFVSYCLYMVYDSLKRCWMHLMPLRKPKCSKKLQQDQVKCYICWLCWLSFSFDFVEDFVWKRWFCWLWKERDPFDAASANKSEGCSFPFEMSRWLLTIFK